jgi:hypothetical protein
VGAPGWEDGEEDEGGVFLYLGSVGGPSTVPWWIADVDQAGARLGFSVSGAGDVDGNGFDDVIAGATRWDGGAVDEGAAFLYVGLGFLDCNCNRSDDADDIANGTSPDCNTNGMPDECETDCNANGVPDDCDIATGTSADCNGNAIPDDCETNDCNGNGVPDECDIASGTSLDCNSNARPDECDVDCNSNGVPDDCDLDSGTSQDCNCDGVPDECNIAGGSSTDTDGNGIPDECETFGTTYCPSAENTLGLSACVFASGSASAGNADLTIAVGSVPNQVALFFHGSNQIRVPLGCGFLCTAADLVRSDVVFASGNAASFTYDNSSSRRSLLDYVGQVRNFQCWYRDPMYSNPCGNSHNLSNAISISIEP